MPELPEVETIVNQLRPRLLGRRIESVWIGWERIVDRPGVEEFRHRLRGQEFSSVQRRGKFLLFTLGGGDTLLVHLRMTGRLLLQASGARQDQHTHAVLGLEDGLWLHYRDVRKFGRLYLVRDAAEVVGGLGPEPLAADFDAAALEEQLATRRARIKSLLLDQRVVAGVGNIYADEALFRSGIHPLRLGKDLTADESARLHGAVRAVLSEAIAHGGSTLQDYQSAGGEPGRFQEQLQVFRRQGEPCPCCGTVLERIRVAGRSTHFCPRCQRERG
jgi:formamidopyrimidine-DNA glycosylase